MMTEFCILPCKCGRTPIINKNIDVIGDDRYTLSHCGLSVNGHTETQCIVNWNELQTKDGETSEE